MNNERLLNVAIALDESKNPHSFSMGSYTRCGTPGCALGHYAARRDLQDEFSLATSDGVNCPLEDSIETDEHGRIRVGAGLSCCAQAVCDHFGISKDEAHELFSGSGCGMAATAKAAAEYIRTFVANNSCR